MARVEELEEQLRAEFHENGLRLVRLCEDELAEVEHLRAITPDGQKVPEVPGELIRKLEVATRLATRFAPVDREAEEKEGEDAQPAEELTAADRLRQGRLRVVG